jgi:micrococcal nuclease
MIALVFAVILVGTEAYADFTGTVVSVLDGDIVKILYNHHPERIRLSGIDCPEKGQGRRR